MSLHTDLLSNKIKLNIAQQIYSHDKILRAYDWARLQDVSIDDLVAICQVERFNEDAVEKLIYDYVKRLKDKEALMNTIKHEGENLGLLEH